MYKTAYKMLVLLLYTSGSTISSSYVVAKQCYQLKHFLASEKSAVLLFHFLQCFQLFRHLVDGVLLLLTQCRHLSLVLSVSFLQVPSQLLQLGLSTLVRFHLHPTRTTTTSADQLKQRIQRMKRVNSLRLAQVRKAGRRY